MKQVSVAPVIAWLLAASPALACPTCRGAVQAGIFNERFWGRLSVTLLPFLVVLVVVSVLHRMGREEDSG